MKKIFLMFLFCFSISSLASNSFIPSHYFNGKSGCFILFDINKNKVIAKYNPVRCQERIPANSSFKIPLSLMAFDQNLISQDTIFKWDGKIRTFSFWNQDQTPKTWLKNSAVWVSQEITPKLGIDKINLYLKKLHYGNQDFSGDKGKHNGLTHAWLSSSLKISGDEQLSFLKNLLTNQLPISQTAMTNTKENMYLETSNQGWKLFGKTGSGKTAHQLNTQKELEDGWFVGFVQKDMQIYAFTLNFSDLEDPKTSETAGLRAKTITKAILQNMGIF